MSGLATYRACRARAQREAFSSARRSSFLALQLPSCCEVRFACCGLMGASLRTPRDHLRGFDTSLRTAMRRISCIDQRIRGGVLGAPSPIIFWAMGRQPTFFNRFLAPLQ